MKFRKSLALVQPNNRKTVQENINNTLFTIKSIGNSAFKQTDKLFNVEYFHCFKRRSDHKTHSEVICSDNFPIKI